MKEPFGPYVVDASAVIPLVAGEPCSERAEEWFTAAAVYTGNSATVDLYDAECTNALWKRQRWAKWSLGDCELALESALSLPFQRVPFRDVAVDALRLAAKLGLTGYDAGYVALARASLMPLVTADRRLAEAVRRAGCEALCLAEDAGTP